MKNVSFSWNGWQYIQGKKSLWRERWNPAFKNNREKVIVTSEEWTKAAAEWAKVFR